MNQNWDAIVIGSGIGGLTTAAALTRLGRRVLVLEKHYVAGGLTHEFSRNGYSWDVGVHYVGAMHPKSPVGKVLSQLMNSPPDFAPMPQVYDRLHLPDDFKFAVRHPKQAFFDDLAERFPSEVTGLNDYRRAIKKATKTASMLFVSRTLPCLLYTSRCV